MKSEFKHCSDEMVGLFDLKNRPIAVTFTNEPMETGKRFPAAGV